MYAGWAPSPTRTLPQIRNAHPRASGNLPAVQ